MTKYAEGGFNAHEKKVFLSENGLELCWADKGSKTSKKVLLADIVNIVKG